MSGREIVRWALAIPSNTEDLYEDLAHTCGSSSGTRWDPADYGGLMKTFLRYSAIVSTVCSPYYERLFIEMAFA